MAEGLKKEEQHLDEDEFLNALKMPLSELLKMVKNNEIKDAKTVIGLLMLGGKINE